MTSERHREVLFAPSARAVGPNASPVHLPDFVAMPDHGGSAGRTLCGITGFFHADVTRLTASFNGYLCRRCLAEEERRA